MPTSLDISVLPIYRQDGYDQSYLPGLEVAAPPRRAARGRRNERLVIFLSMDGGAQISPSLHSQILEKLIKGYFKTSGTATTAMREVVDNLNDYLFKRNRSASGRGRQVIARLTLVVFRDDRLYMAQCGSLHALLLTSTGIDHFHDPESAGRGLGMSQTSTMRFFQADIAPADLLIMTPDMPDGWDEDTFHGGFDHNLPVLRRRMLADAGADLMAVLIAADTGSGQIELLRSPDALPAKLTPVQPAQPQAAPEPAREPAPEPVRQTPLAPEMEMPKTSVVSTSPVAAQEPAQQKAPIVAPALLNARRGVAEFFGKLGRGLGTFLGRMLPEDAELRLPRATMAFIAVAVPVVIVTIAGVVYSGIGRQTQYDYNIGNAQIIADYALTLDNRVELHQAWSSALVFINEAERYIVTDETQTLRAQALLILDDLDGVTRIEFERAIVNTLSASVNIQRMLATGSDLFMLDANDGVVLRAALTGSGRYTMDDDYRCGPGQYGQDIVVKLVDIAVLPRPTQAGATIVAIDSNGILLYCSADSPPIAAALIPPDNNWGNPRAIAVENGNLYVLDALVNAVWIYSGEDLLFEEPPRFFFAAQVPSIQNSVDIALDGGDLYLLQSDGTMITCIFSDLAEAPTTCEQPARYSASPSGEAESPLNGLFTFTKMAHTPAPEPSIYLLDAANQRVYHFSLRLNLAAQYRTATALPEGEIVAFAVSPTRILFIAIGNEIFVAILR